jgi:hypothetical protein
MFAFSAHKRCTHGFVDVYRGPDEREITMHALVCGIEARGVAQNDLENAGLRLRETQSAEFPAVSVEIDAHEDALATVTNLYFEVDVHPRTSWRACSETAGI